MTSSPESVVLCYLHSYSVASVFADAIFRTYEYERDTGAGRLRRTLSFNAGAMQIDHARNEFARLFLEKSDSDWLWMVDSDIGFPPHTLERLQTSCVERGLDVLGGLYNGVWGTRTNDNGSVELEARPLIYLWDNESLAFNQATSWSSDDEVIEVDGTGAGCMLIRRSTLQSVFDEFGTWFDLINPDPSKPSRRLSEDLSFCLRVRKLGLRIGVDTKANLVHQKPMWV